MTLADSRNKRTPTSAASSEPAWAPALGLTGRDLIETPEGFRAADVLVKADSVRVERGDHHITEEHVADAIELLLATRQHNFR